MAAALTLLALLLELMIGYPDRLMAMIGHPVTWIGALIGALDRRLNRDTATAAARRMAGTVTVLILIAAVGSVAFMVERGLSGLPFGWVVAALPASTLLAQRSLHQHVERVAGALETAGIAAARQAVSHIVGPRRRTARPSRRGAGRDREPGGEFLRRRGGAGLLDGDRRPGRRRHLQGGQHRRQHDRPSHAAARGLRLGGRPARRSRQSAGIAPCRRC